MLEETIWLFKIAMMNGYRINLKNKLVLYLKRIMKLGLFIAIC